MWCSGSCGDRSQLVASICILILGVFGQAAAQCSLPSAVVGTWYRASDGIIVTINSAGMDGHDIKGGSTSYSSFNCFESNADKHMFGPAGTVDGIGGSEYARFCWKLVKLTDVTYFLYQLTAVATSGTFLNQRVVSTLSTAAPPVLSDACTLDSNTEVPTLLYKLPNGAATDVDVTSLPGSAAVQQCPPEVFATYTYIKDGSGCSGSSSELDFCVDLQSARVDYSLCSTKILFSADGLLSCVASFSRNSNTYFLLVNHDATVDKNNYFRFACMKVTASGNTQQATVYPGDCTATTGTHELALTRTVSCEPTTTSGNTGGGTTGVGTSENPASGGLDLIPIIAGVVVAVVIIALVVLVVVLYKKVYSVRMSRAVTPIKAEQNGKTPHEKVDNDLPPSSDHPEVQTSARLPPLELDTAKLPPLRL